jgi:hypothetical protein
MKSRPLIVAVLVVLAVGGFLAFTNPGHQALSKLGFSAACSSDDGCSS